MKQNMVMVREIMKPSTERNRTHRPACPRFSVRVVVTYPASARSRGGRSARLRAGQAMRIKFATSCKLATNSRLAPSCKPTTPSTSTIAHSLVPQCPRWYLQDTPASLRQTHQHELTHDVLEPPRFELDHT